MNFRMKGRSFQKRRALIFLAAGVICIAAASFLLFQSRETSIITFKKEAYTTEAGRPYDLNAMVESINSDEIGTVSCTDNVNTEAAGTYHGSCTFAGKTAELDIEVVDTTPPELALRKVTAGTDQEIDVYSFIVSSSDLSSYAVEIVKPDSFVLKEGSWPVTIRAIDVYGNETVKKTTLTRKDGAVFDQPETSDSSSVSQSESSAENSQSEPESASSGESISSQTDSYTEPIDSANP